MSKCELLPKGSSKAEKEAAHKERMKLKKVIRDRRFSTLQGSPEHVPANLSRNHPDYGLSWAEHLKKKGELVEK